MQIGEVAQQSGVSVRMLRHYDKIGLLTPSTRSAGGYREYDDGDLQRLFRIESLRTLGLSLAEVAVALADSGADPGALIDRLITQTKERLAAEADLLERLSTLRSGAPQRWAQVEQLLPLIRGLQSVQPVRRQLSALGMDAGDAVRLAEPLTQAVLAETEPITAGALKWALRRSGDAALGPLASALDDPDPLVRRRAVEAIAESPSDAATATLSALLDHDDPVLRRRAALAVGPRGVAQALPVLLQMVIDGVADVDAAEALGALARRRDRAEDLVDLLVTQVNAAADPGARLRLTQALAEVPGPPTVAALSRLRDDEDPNVARSANYLVRLLSSSS
ncbi:MerR family DNA-binding transcriptional regulator [Gordonia alkaliphila]|uniref:MerR family transcriptional regulator n=1 Tax=Gordonia alkaliphila TaxID=1053547 RepID=A0ABP8Z9A3_9ACTN